MTVTVLYYAVLRERRGIDQETIETGPIAVRDLYCRLQTEHGFQLDAAHVRSAVNGAFVRNSYVLNDGDEVVFIPPVAGG